MKKCRVRCGDKEWSQNMCNTGLLKSKNTVVKQMDGKLWRNFEILLNGRFMEK